MGSKLVAKILVIIFFVGLLAAPKGIKKFNEMRNTESPMDRQEIIDRYGFYLDEVSESVGIDFTHHRSQLDPELDHILPQVASVGASVTVTDYNNNGLQDIYLTNSKYGTNNAFYENQGDDTFRDIADELGIADVNKEGTGASMGSIWGDYNNNGYEDLFIYKWGNPELYRNDEGEGFTRVTEEAGLPEWINANTAVWLDYNGNGLLDLFIGGYFHEDVNHWDLSTTRIMPDSYEYATNGGRNFLLENQGDGTFKDVSEETGLLATRRWTLAAAAADLNGSGYPEIVLANDYGVDELFVNQNGRKYINAGQDAGMGFVPKSGMSVAFGDIMNQGELSIYVTNISESGFLMQGNNLWTPSRQSSEGELSYRNMAGSMGVEVGEWGYGGQFIDLNNNGNLDLYVANGYISAEPNTDYWYDFAKVVGGNENIISDASNWPAMNNRTFSGYQTNKIWLNDGAGRYRDVANVVGGGLDLDSRAIAYADLFGNGTMDLIVANQHGPVKVYRNEVDADNQWVGFKLEGRKSNRNAIGAIVELHWNGQKQRRVVTGGDAFSSQSQRAVHFGLGKNPDVEKLEIRWPSGIQQVIEAPELNKVHTITEAAKHGYTNGV